MAISKIPGEVQIPTKVVSEKAIQEFINRGGKPTTEKESKNLDKAATKSIKLIMTGKEMSAIKELRDKRPSRSRKIPISVHDWVIEAVQEKIEREQKKYGLTLI